MQEPLRRSTDLSGGRSGHYARASTTNAFTGDTEVDSDDDGVAPSTRWASAPFTGAVPAHGPHAAAGPAAGAAAGAAKYSPYAATRAAPLVGLSAAGPAGASGIGHAAVGASPVGSHAAGASIGGTPVSRRSDQRPATPEMPPPSDSEGSDLERDVFDDDDD
jgi:hypothetical protein